MVCAFALAAKPCQSANLFPQQNQTYFNVKESQFLGNGSIMEKKALVPIVLLVVLAGVAAIVSQSSQLVVPTLPPISPSGEDCEVGSCPDGSTYQKYHWNGTSCDLVQYFRDPCTPNPTPNWV